MADGLHGVSIAAWLGLFACFPACTGLEPAPALPPARCTDFSGTHWYPGYEHQADVCTLLSTVEFGVGLPVPGSAGWSAIVTPTDVHIEQQGCERIGIVAPFGMHFRFDDYDRVLENFRRLGGRYEIVYDLAYDYLPNRFRIDRWARLEIDLHPGAKREVRWGKDSLYLRYRFRAEGFGAGWSRNYLTLRLRKLPGGALRYELRHDEIPGSDAEIACTLAPAPEGTQEVVESSEKGADPSAL